MAPLPDLPEDIRNQWRSEIEHLIAARSHADGSSRFAGVYAALFHDPVAATKVAALGEQLRFHGALPDDVRELAILRYSARCRFGYEWSHHIHPAHLAGIGQATIDAITVGDVPDGLRAEQRAALAAVDAIVAGQSIPGQAQQQLIDACGTAGVTELTILCGVYAIMGYTVAAFDIEVEDGLPPAPF